MDFETYAMCKPLAKTIPAVTLTFDGNVGDKVTFDGTEIGADEGIVYVRISPNYYDLTKAKSIEVVEVDTVETINLAEADFGSETTNYGSVIGEGASCFVVSFSAWVVDAGYQSGTYVVTQPEMGVYISKIEFPEIVQTIEPKYLPVVEITSAEYPSTGTVALSAAENAQLNAYADAKMPCTIRLCKDNEGMPMVISAQFILATTAVGRTYWAYLGESIGELGFIDDGTRWSMGQ